MENVIDIAKSKMENIKADSANLMHKSVMIEANSVETLNNNASYCFLVEVDPGVRVESNDGVYCDNHPTLLENVEIHKGKTTFTNYTNVRKKVKYLEATPIFKNR